MTRDYLCSSQEYLLWFSFYDNHNLFQDLLSQTNPSSVFIIQNFNF